jgi:hypothetical protein
MSCRAPGLSQAAMGRSTPRQGQAWWPQGDLLLLSADAQIWLLTLYDKDEMVDLSAAEKRALKVALEAELARRAVQRRLRRK